MEVKYDLGSGPVTLTSSTPVNLGAWNKLAVKRYRQVGPVKGVMQGKLIAVVYTLRTQGDQLSLGGICKQ